MLRQSDLLSQLTSNAGRWLAKYAESDAERWVIPGVEMQSDPAKYYWHGMQRGADAEHPFVVMQYTLAGSGIYSEAGNPIKVPPGHLFIAVIPGDHAYYLPSNQEPWTFFYLIVRHPYVVQRLTATQQGTGPVFALGGDETLLIRLASIVQAVHTVGFRDQWAVEQALLEVAVEYDRFANYRLYPPDRREEMLDGVRKLVLARRGLATEVEQVAAVHGMSRSHFSHYFKAATGLSPAKWIKQIAMDEAVRLLLSTDLKLEAIARENGFADANHFCKSFRRRFHLSPGEFRRQMRHAQRGFTPRL